MQKTSWFPKPHRRLDLTGKKLGGLLVVSSAGSDGAHSIWNCRCSCGRECVKKGKDLNKAVARGQMFFCSHECPLSRAAIGRRQQTHGASRTPLFAVWHSMRQRCENPNQQAYHNYGGRGIKVCARWGEYVNFLEDMGGSYLPGLTLDRRENSGNYSKENCRWVTHRVQANNKRGNVAIDTPRGSMTVSQASRAFGINVTTLLYRIAHDWPAERMFDTPSFSNRIVETVYDIRNCGPRNQFVVRGKDGQLMTVHNCTQATARDVFGEHIVALDKAGYTNLFSSHDEAILEVDNDVTAHDIEAIMSQTPEWLEGCPISAEAKIVSHYEK